MVYGTFAEVDEFAAIAGGGGACLGDFGFGGGGTVTGGGQRHFDGWGHGQFAR